MSTEKIRKTGGNNTPLVESDADCICIAGNIIDRQPENGGNGMGWQKGLSYTLTATDRHALFARQRVDAFRADYIASTESARQHKDATDLVMNVMQKLKQPIQLIRRLIPLECERLQGFPDGWTNVPDASDSPRYKALGNSVYLIMVVMRRTDVKQLRQERIPGAVASHNVLCFLRPKTFQPLHCTPAFLPGRH